MLTVMHVRIRRVLLAAASARLHLSAILIVSHRMIVGRRPYLCSIPP